MTKEEKREKLIALKAKMKADKSLPLREGNLNLVFGEGNADADVMFIGEGPGYWEDQKGRPFVGRAGQLLNELLQSIELERSEVFITNVVHYRPPNNRDPEPKEMEAFQKYLDKMIEIVHPKVISSLGRFSMAKFIPGVTISTVHGNPRQVEWNKEKLWVVPMYHPAAALRNGSIKERAFKDFKNLRKILDKIK